MTNVPISKACLQRLPVYLRYLQGKYGEGNISSSAIAEDLKLNAVLVRKDLALVASVAGKPKTGYVVADLVRDLERYLGYDNTTEAALVGVGHLGTALLAYDGFAGCGMKIVTAFDTDPAVIDTEVGGVRIFGPEKLDSLVRRLRLKIGIITVPKEQAQTVCDKLVAAGVTGIWNFAPTHLSVPERVAVKNEDLAASLAILTKQLTALKQNDNTF